MKREYSVPIVEYEAYSLTSHVAGACADAGKTPVGDVEPIDVNGRVHCVDLDNKAKECSVGAHTWEVKLGGTIFADGDKIDGCTHDVYTEEAYASLLARSLTSGSTVSGGPCKEHGGKHFIFKGGSHQHIAAFQDVDFRNYFQS